MTDLVPIRRALLSVSDKAGLEPLAAALVARGVELVSTGGTATALRALGHAVKDVAELTGSPEMMDGRVKTLHPRVHGGLLALRNNEDHVQAMADNGIAAIDLAVINLYPFAATVAKGAPRDEIIENIDIGGPAMVRSSAKNHDFVAILTSPDQYDEFIAALDANDGATPLALRRRLAAAAFAHTAAYDAAVASWFAFADQGEMFPAVLPVALTRKETLRYGENPHQQAALYLPQGRSYGIAAARQVQGKELSYNNLNDADGALDLIAEWRDAGPACAIIKHANPCGVATGATLADAYEKAFRCDPVSAFGGIIAVNQPLDGPTAEAITGIFTEVVIAPGADEDALKVFARSAPARPDAEADFGRHAGAEPGQWRRAACRLPGCHPAHTDRRRMGRPDVCLDRGAAREIQCHCLCQRRRHGGHRRWPDEPARFHPDRGPQGDRRR
jgi:phosphoribosylaminoimidazolecarboxamide formyltransferase/IMP cyclohydrolase